MLIYVNITDRQTVRQTDKQIKSIVRNLTIRKIKASKIIYIVGYFCRYVATNMLSFKYKKKQVLRATLTVCFILNEV
jgi:hypothetical protein